MNSDKLIGLAYALSLFHRGQWSKEYRLLCRINWQPRGQAEYLLPKDEWFNARNWAAYYIQYLKKDVK